MSGPAARPDTLPPPGTAHPGDDTRRAARPPSGAALAVAIRTTAAGLGLWALVHTLRSGVAQPGVALAFGALIAVGELARQGPAGAHRAPEERERAPLGAAGALAYALLGEVAGAPATRPGADPRGGRRRGSGGSGAAAWPRAGR